MAGLRLRSASGSYVSLTDAPADIKRSTGPSGTEYALTWQVAGAAHSGLRGLKLSRSATGFPAGLTLESVAGTPTWDTIALDATTTDLVLAYSHLAQADQIRIRDGGTNGPNILISPSAGQPSTSQRLHLVSNATDATITRLNYWEIASGSSATDFVRGQFNGTENFNVTKNGFGAFGLTYTGAVTNGGLEAATAATIIGASVNPELLLKRTTDLSKSYLLDITSGGTLRLRDNSRGQNVVIVDTNGNVGLGQDNAQLATSATTGFVYVHSMAGTPTGTPTALGTGLTPFLIDTTGSKICAYIGGAWKSVALV